MRRPIEVEVIRSIWKEIGNHLATQKKQIYEQIRDYPPPITACDQQFNYLIEERAVISQELKRMEAVSQESLIHQDALEVIEGFIDSSPHLNDEIKQKAFDRFFGSERRGGQQQDHP